MSGVMRWLAAVLLLPGLMAVGGMVGARSAVAATGQGDWPCIQRKVPELTLGVVWTRGDLPEAARQAEKDPRVARAAETLAPRRTAMEAAGQEIKTFAAAAAGPERDILLQALFLALFDRMNAERRQVMRGIERYGHRQFALATKLKTEQHEVDRLAADQAADPAKVSDARDQLLWNTRMFDERQKSLSFVCEVPTIIERRLYALARLIEGEMGK